MAFLDKLNKYINQALIWIAGALLSAMIFLTCANVFLRIFERPVPGTFELMGYFSAVAMAFALGYTQISRGHIAVDILVQRFSEGTNRFLSLLNSIICAAFFAFVSFQIAKYATTLLRTGEVTETLRIIYYPFTYGAALGCAALSLVFLIDLLKLLARKKEDHK